MSFAKIMDKGGPAAKKIQQVIDSWDGFQEIDLDELFKKIDYKVCLKNLFSDKKLKLMGSFEKRRLKNMSRHLTVLYWMGENDLLFIIFST